MPTFANYKDQCPCIRMRREDGILELRLHTDGGPLRFAPDMTMQLATAFREIARDRANSVVILTGTGEEFSGPRADPNAPLLIESVAEMESLHSWGVELMDSLLSIQTPVIAAVNGPALRHCEIALMSDIVICSENAVFEDTGHIPRGSTPGDGINVVTPAIMGLTRARYFHLTGQAIGAAQALDWGLVNEVVPREQLLDRAWELARSIRRAGDMVLRHTRILFTHELRKRMMDQLGYGLSLESLEMLGRRVPVTADPKSAQDDTTTDLQQR